MSIEAAFPRLHTGDSGLLSLAAVLAAWIRIADDTAARDITHRVMTGYTPEHF
jgi:hypothetical protein